MKMITLKVSQKRLLSRPGRYTVHLSRSLLVSVSLGKLSGPAYLLSLYV